jgi:hypothetical protein
MRGVFRDDEDWARVRYGDGREIDMPKAQYLALKRQPPFEDSPLKRTFGGHPLSGRKA